MVDWGAFIAAIVALITPVAFGLRWFVNRAIRNSEALSAIKDETLVALETRVEQLENKLAQTQDSHDADLLAFQEDRNAWNLVKEELAREGGYRQKQIEELQADLVALQADYQTMHDAYTCDQDEWIKERAENSRQIEHLTQQVLDLTETIRIKSGEIKQLRDDLRQAILDKTALSAQLEAYTTMLDRLDGWVRQLVEGFNIPAPRETVQ